jgi:guanine deaminase
MLKTMTPDKETWMKEALKLAHESMESGQGGPFGAVIVRNGEIIGRGSNRVTSSNDPTAHAEVVAIRDAFTLAGSEIYTSCEPCPMCLAAIYWARLDKIYFANTRLDAARIGFDDDFLYREMILSHAERSTPIAALPSEEALATFALWMEKSDKVAY